MPRKLRFLLLFLLLSAAAAAAALVSVFVGGENGDRVRERSGVETGLFSSAAPPFPRAVSGDDEKDLLLRRRRYFSFRSPPFPSLSALSSSSSSSSEIDALAARVAARLEPLLLQQARTSADDGTREGGGQRSSRSLFRRLLPRPLPLPRLRQQRECLQGFLPGRRGGLRRLRLTAARGAPRAPQKGLGAKPRRLAGCAAEPRQRRSAQAPGAGLAARVGQVSASFCFFLFLRRKEEKSRKLETQLSLSLSKIKKLKKKRKVPRL